MAGFGQQPPARKGNLLSMLSASFAGLTRPIEPSAAWDGIAASGFITTPTDPVRTTAKPACRLLVPPDQHFTDSLVVGVQAFANNGGTLIGGIDRVRFHFEGNVLDVVQPRFNTIIDANGLPRSYYGYWVEIKKPSGVAGIAQLYIEAIPADATMQHRIMGPYHFSPVDTLYDRDIEVAASLAPIAGQRFQTLDLAVKFIRGANSNNARIRITEAGLYAPAMSGFVPGSVVEGTGYTVIEATVPGVVIGNATEPATDTLAVARPMRNGLWFKGANLSIDFRHILQIDKEIGARENGFDGCRLFNSAGRDQYWQLGVRPINPYDGRPYFLEADMSGITNTAVLANLVRGCLIHGTFGDIFTGALAVIGNRAEDHDSSFFARDVPALAVRYSGAAAAATLALTGGNDATLRTFTLVETGQANRAFSVGRLNNRDGYTVQDVANWINAQTGWTATVIDNTRRASAISLDSFKGAGFAAQDAKSADLTLVTMFDLHADFYQQLFNVELENVIVSFNTAIDVAVQNVLLNAVNPNARDYVVVNNAIWNNPSNLGYISNENLFSQLSGSAHSHVVVAHNSWANQGWLLRYDLGYNPDPRCLFANNSVRSIGVKGTVAGALMVANNHLHAGNAAPPTAIGTVIGGDDASLYANAVAGDFTPAGDLASNPKPPVLAVDLNHKPRGAANPVGAGR